MFISNNERIQLRTDIETLCKIIGDLNTEVVYLKAKVKVLEGKKAAQAKPKKQMTEAQRAKQREYAKRYQAKKRMEKKNGNSISTTGV